MQIIDGRKIRDEILQLLKERVHGLPFKPVFCDVLVGDDPASAQYVRMKEQVAESLGIRIEKGTFPESISTEDLISSIQHIAQTPHMAGLIVQLPLPSHIDRQAVLNAVPLVLDVDTTGAQASQLFYENKALYAYPTALAVLAVLDSLALDLSEKKIVMVGQGMLVGKPVTHMLRARGLDVTVVDRDTPDPTSLFKNADVLISAVGKPHFITKDDLKQGVIVIDAGTSELEGGVVGDIDPEGLSSVASAFSPVPGGVGPVTVAMLMQNIVQSAEKMK